jgi:hypothetical protein
MQENNNIEKRMEMLDRRLDNIDSVVTNLVERVMTQTVTIECTCPKCGSVVQINLPGSIRTVTKS